VNETTPNRPPRLGDVVVFHQGPAHPGGSRAIPAFVHETSGDTVVLTTFSRDGATSVEINVPHRDGSPGAHDRYWRWASESPE
jgi:hypothetical protein